MVGISSGHEADLIHEPGIKHSLRVTLVAVLASALSVAAFTLFLRWSLIPLALLATAASLAGLGLAVQVCNLFF